MRFDNIDEINIFNNGDSSFCMEIHISDTESNRITMKIPRATMDLIFTTGYGEGMTIELKLEGMIEK